jgi:hypothetical protein
MVNSEAHAGGVSGRWRALTRTLVRSMLHGQTVDVSSRLIPLISDAIVDALLVAGCQGTRTQVHGQLTQRFNKKIAVIVAMALRLNEVIGEEITSCELKAISMPYGVAFSPRTMDDGYDDGKWHGLASESPLVLCTTELGLQKEVKGYDGGWQRMVLTKPKVSLESLTNDMELRQVRSTYPVLVFLVGVNEKIFSDCNRASRLRLRVAPAIWAALCDARVPCQKFLLNIYSTCCDRLRGVDLTCWGPAIIYVNIQRDTIDKYSRYQGMMSRR